MLLCALALVTLQAKPAFEFSVDSGLRVKVAGIPVVTGSWLQYYADGWTKGYYSTSNDQPKVKQVDPDTYLVEFSGYNGGATGQITYHRDGERLHVHYDLHWSGDKPAKIELTAGMISAQVVQNGTLTADGKPARSMAPTKYLIPSMEERKFAPDASEYVFDSPLAKVSVKTAVPTTLFDARGYDQDYAEGKSLFWCGALGLDVSKDKATTYDVDWQFHPNPVPEAKTNSLTLTSTQAPDVVSPDQTPPLILPKPKNNELKFDKPLPLTGAYDFPAGRVRFWEADFLGGLVRRFEVPAKSKTPSIIRVDGGVSKLGFHPGGYQITVTPNSISVLGEEDEGLHNGLRRLAMLAFPKNGKLCLPTGYLSSNPQIAWRGVHMFVGPESRAFQKRLWERVLLPLGFNKVVLQCERTEWDSMPNMKGVAGNMTRQDLAGLFADYRAMGVEPIPLIQSFGHMEWFFQNGQNLDLAMNPSQPYAIDPRKPKANELLTSIWAEACGLLKPSMLHFGCDEVDMIGFPNDDSKLVTDLWIQQIGVLKGIAAKNNAQMMIWGDKGLAPSEAIDATNGDSTEEAAKRRAALPKGAWIADWHYKADSKIERFLPSLQLWKKEGFKPVASAWYQPDNVRGMDLAADVEKVGTLQTTWSGYYSSEPSMIQNWNQFSAMVLAADYSWSTRYDAVSKLGYDPGQVLRDLYFAKPRPVSAASGLQVYQGSPTGELSVKDLHFKLGEPILLRSLLSAPQAPASIDLHFEAKGKHLAFLVDAVDQCDEGERLAEFSMQSADGKLMWRQPIVYGQQVRASIDGGMTPLADRINGMSVIEVQLPATVLMSKIHLESLSSRGGIRVLGMLAW